MTKTQIQVPEELLAEIRDFSRRREWSLAETFRRGAELLLETYPDEAPAGSQPWVPPTSGKVGWKGLSAEQLRDLAFEDQTRDRLAQ
jgi:hypothetical protein